MRRKPEGNLHHKMDLTSAIKPICLISGRISSRAMAAPVVVRIILLNTWRFFRRSETPACGTASSSIFWLPVVAWMVDMEAVIIPAVSPFPANGLTACASPVVVQLAAEIRFTPCDMPSSESRGRWLWLAGEKKRDKRDHPYCPCMLELWHIFNIWRIASAFSLII